MGTPELRTCPVKLTCEVGNSGPPGVGVRGGWGDLPFYLPLTHPSLNNYRWMFSYICVCTHSKKGNISGETQMPHRRQNTITQFAFQQEKLRSQVGVLEVI